jgi:hypothetical protein
MTGFDGNNRFVGGRGRVTLGGIIGGSFGFGGEGFVIVIRNRVVQSWRLVVGFLGWIHFVV